MVGVQGKDKATETQRDVWCDMSTLFRGVQCENNLKKSRNKEQV